MQTYDMYSTRRNLMVAGNYCARRTYEVEAVQFLEEKRETLLATPRLRTALLRRDVACDFKQKVWELNE